MTCAHFTTGTFDLGFDAIQDLLCVSKVAAKAAGAGDLRLQIGASSPVAAASAARKRCSLTAGWLKSHKSVKSIVMASGVSPVRQP